MFGHYVVVIICHYDFSCDKIYTCDWKSVLMELWTYYYVILINYHQQRNIYLLCNIV